MRVPCKVDAIEHAQQLASVPSRAHKDEQSRRDFRRSRSRCIAKRAMTAMDAANDLQKTYYDYEQYAGHSS